MNPLLHTVKSLPGRCILALIVLLGACSEIPQQQGIFVWPGPNVAEPKIQFLGVGGWLLHWRGEGLLLAPSFSNQSTLGIPILPPLWVAADRAKIDRLMPPAKDVSMILVGHGHYDHLLDVPWIMQHHTPNALVYGSRSVAHMLRGMVPASRVVSSEWAMARANPALGPRAAAQGGSWITSRDKHIRVMPIENQHAPQLAGYLAASGSYQHDLTGTPVFMLSWKLGQSMAWLIDLLDERGKTVYRLHYQDSAASAPYGLPPILADGKRIDVQILSVGSWSQVEGYPIRLLQATQPRMVLLGHWDNFFGNDPAARRQTLIPFLNAKPMVDITRVTVGPAVPVLFPAPLAFIALPAPL